MEASSGLSNRVPPSKAALVNGSWLAVPNCGVPVVFDADNGFRAALAWAMFSFMTEPGRKDTTGIRDTSEIEVMSNRRSEKTDKNTCSINQRVDRSNVRRTATTSPCLLSSHPSTSAFPDVVHATGTNFRGREAIFTRALQTIHCVPSLPRQRPHVLDHRALCSV